MKNIKTLVEELRKRGLSNGASAGYHSGLMDEAADTIERLQAEIERLEAEIDKQYEQARADILGNMADGGTSCHWCIEEHRARAIKEFAERLKEKCTKLDDCTNARIIIDNLVKEMVGERDG